MDQEFDSKTMSNMEQLRPILEQLAVLCEGLKLPYVALVQLDGDREAAVIAGQSAVVCSYNLEKDVENVATPIADAIRAFSDEDEFDDVLKEEPKGPRLLN